MQRLIVAQIKQAAGQPSNDLYSGALNYDNAPWFDWGPYLWADGENFRSDGLNWCNYQSDLNCQFARDVRDGDRFGDPDLYWGDFTHPSAAGAKKVADLLVKFFTKSVVNGGSPFVQHWRLQ